MTETTRRPIYCPRRIKATECETSNACAGGADCRLGPDLSETAAACPIVAAVTADLQARAALGLRKYGVTLADNPLTRKQWLQHAYEEMLDGACYLKRLIEMEPINGD